MGKVNKHEKQRPRRTIDAAGLGARLKNGEPDVTDVWAEQRKIHTSETIKLEATPLIDKAALKSGASKVKEVVIELNLNLGTVAARAWGCDLTKGYIDINTHYN